MTEIEPTDQAKRPDVDLSAVDWAGLNRRLSEAVEAFVDAFSQVSAAAARAHWTEEAAAADWPFKVGDVVSDVEGAEAEWLEAAPERTWLKDVHGTYWQRVGFRWALDGRSVYMSSTTLAEHYGPLTVASPQVAWATHARHLPPHSPQLRALPGGEPV